MTIDDAHGLSQPYWEGLRQHRLLIQRCLACATLRHYPRPVCPSCFSMDFDWAQVAGDGAIHTWTVTHHAFSPALRGQLPLTLVTVDLAAGVRLHAPLRGHSADDLRIGRRVHLIFETTDAGLVLPAFRPAP